MKKFLPFLALAGASLIITGCSNNLTKIDIKQTKKDLNSFNSEIKSLDDAHKTVSASVNNKYLLSVDTPTTLELTEDNLVEGEQSTITENAEDILTEEHEENNENEDIIEENIDENSTEENEDENITNTNELSTLYSITNDVDASCNDFCKLKEEITSAIAETERLIEKIESNEIDLNREQRLILNEQAMQLKSLSKQLSNTTMQLSYNLSDLKQILNENNTGINDLSLKYLIVLDNLVNSNEMLQSGLTSLSMMNQILNNQNNGEKRMIFGYKENNNKPIIKDYSINENGELIENPINNSSKDDNVNTIDTYNESGLKNNIDSYYSNTPKNIDSFFNTALLDNEFMYGNGGIYGGYGYGMNPYMGQYAQYERNQNNAATQGIENGDNTQYTPNNSSNQLDKDGEKVGNKERKKFTIQKNIDTYKDENTPDLKTRFNNFKQSITNAFGAINPNEDIKKPIYKF